MSRPLDPRLLRAVPRLRRLTTALVVLQCAAAAAAVTQAVALADTIAGVLDRGVHGSALRGPLLLLVMAMLARAVTGSAQEWLVTTASAAVRADLRRQVLAAVRRLGPSWVAGRPSGSLATTAGAGLDALDAWTTRALPALIGAVVVPPVALVALGWVDWRSLVVLLVVLPLVPVFMALVGVSTGRRMQERYAALARLSGHFLDLVQGLTTLKVYGQARRQVTTVRAATEAYRRQTLATLRLAFLSGLVLDLLATLSVAVLAVSVGLRLDHGSVGLRSALVVLLLAPEVFAPLRAVGAQHHATEEGRVAAAAALDLLDAASSVPPPATTAAAVRTDGTVRLRGLTVAYPDRDRPALSGVDLTLRAGETVALRGRSGAGKSTVLSVLLGLTEPSAGAVAVGTRAGLLPLTPASVELARTCVAWVPQRPVPTQPTVADEVALGWPDAPEVVVRQAISQCRAPSGATPLGEDGRSVSAGQRRRVALARVLLRAWSVRAAGGVPLVLLDEPSEDLDPDTERVVASVVGGLAGWATVLMVTHSDLLAGVAGRRVELAGGRVVDDRPQLPSPVPDPEPAPTAPRPAAATAADVVASWRDLLPALRPARHALTRAALLSGSAGFAGTALTATSLWLICRAGQHPNLQALSVAVVGVRTFALLRALLRYAERLAGHDVALRLLASLRADVFARLEPLVPGGLPDLRRGELLRRFVADVDAAQDAVVRTLLPVVGGALASLAACAVAAGVQPVAGAALAGGLVVALVVAPAVAARLGGDRGVVAAAAGRRDARVTALLDGLAELTAYSAVDRAADQVVAADAVAVEGTRRIAAGAAAGQLLTGVASALTLPAVLALTADSPSVARVSVGVAAAAVLTGFDTLAGIPAAFAAWSRVRASLDRVAALLAAPAPVAEPLRPGVTPSGRLGLQVAHASVAPAPGAAPVVRSADLALRPGERLAVTGPSGCGKTTLLHAAARLLPLQGGAVEVAGDDAEVAVHDLAAAAVPPLVAGSLQGDHVFDASLRDNLRVVRPDATDADLDAVAARTGLSAFVASLPSGWDTAAGADGAALSGGQRQRLLLARALLAAPAVLVLDEPAAHLDPDTADEVLGELLRGTDGATVLLTTHRPLPAGSVDAVLRLQDGIAWQSRTS